MLIICVSVLIYVGLVLIQERSFFGLVLGLILLSNGIVLSIFLGSAPTIGQFAFITELDLALTANDPLPQALVLTAIVIGFALLGFVIALIKKVSTVIGDLNAEAMKVEEASE